MEENTSPQANLHIEIDMLAKFKTGFRISKMVKFKVMNMESFLCQRTVFEK